MCKMILNILGLVLIMNISSYASDCLNYEPAVVQLHGKIMRETFPGPPNYESIEEGDMPETYWILNLKTPVCIHGKKGDEIDIPRQNISKIQLILDSGQYKKFSSLLGKDVIVTGMLTGSISGHHHTTALLTVQDIIKRP